MRFDKHESRQGTVGGFRENLNRMEFGQVAITEYMEKHKDVSHSMAFLEVSKKMPQLFDIPTIFTLTPALIIFSYEEPCQWGIQCGRRRSKKLKESKGRYCVKVTMCVWIWHWLRTGRHLVAKAAHASALCRNLRNYG
jgi:hypothetical protein